MKAAQYTVGASKTSVHDLVQNSLVLDDSHLTSLSEKLELLVGDSTRMRYPDQVRSPNDEIPNDVYTEKIARMALELATEILDNIRSRRNEGVLSKQNNKC